MDAALKALIVSCDTGSPQLLAGRVFPAYSPQAPTLAQIVYRLVTAPRDYKQDGPDGVTTFRYQLDVYALENETTEAVRDMLISGMSGQLGDVYAGVKVQAAFLDNDQLFGVPDLDTPGPRQFRRVLDWLVTAEHG